MTDAERGYLDGRIRTLDDRIDELVRSLYGLDADDMNIIEGALGGAPG